MDKRNKKIKKISLKLGISIITFSLLLKGLPHIKNLQISKSAVDFLENNTLSISTELPTGVNLVTANVQNGRNGFEESISKVSNIFYDYEGNNIYCLQESSETYISELLDELGDDYKTTGDYRLGNINYEYNEGNPIITNASVKDSITFKLSFVPDNLIDLGISLKDLSIIPRIAVLTILENEHSEEFICLNTHLDYNIPSLQEIQLKQIYTILSAIPVDYPIVVTGDFNMEPTVKNFIDFKNKLETIGILEIENNEDTYKGNEHEPSKKVDYIFSRGFNFENEIIYTSPEESDHNFLLVKSK